MVFGLPQVLGRVITGVLEIRRGPDVVHRVAVEKSLFQAGAEISLVLPRNLTCAACSGGGCDGCDRAGAITLRERGDSPEVLRVTLPPRSVAELEREPGVVLRVPDQGGFPAAGSALPRGLLFLKVEASEASDAGVKSTAFPLRKKAKRAKRHPRPGSGQELPESQRRRRGSAAAYANVILALSWIALAVAHSASLPR